MKASLIKFGEIEVEGKTYDHDVVIDGGKVWKRKKTASKAYREKYGHTPLTVLEDLPWGGRQLIIGTGVYGRLPIMKEVEREAERRHVALKAMPTEEACRLLEKLERDEVYAVLHATC